MSYDYEDDIIFGGSVVEEEEKYEPINFLEKFSISSVDNLTLEEQEVVANKLVDEVLKRASKSSRQSSNAKSRQYIDPGLPSHLEKFKQEYEKISGKRQPGVQLPLIRQVHKIQSLKST